MSNAAYILKTIGLVIVMIIAFPLMVIAKLLKLR